MHRSVNDASRTGQAGRSAIRVAYITTVPVQGGAELNLLRLLPHLEKIGVTPAVILAPPGGGVSEGFESAGYHVRRFNLHRRHWRSIWRYGQSLTQLVWPIIRSRAELVHINHHYGLEYTVPAARLARRPFAIHMRGIEPVDWVHRNRVYLERSKRVIAVSQAVRDRLVEGGISAGRIEVIYDGVDLDRFARPLPADTLRNEWQIPENCRLVGIVGRMESLKGIADFLQAAQRVRQRLGDVRFAIVGDGQPDYVNSMKALSHDLGLANSVVFPGFQSDIPPVLAALDLLVVATYDPVTGQGEACPNIVLEAMANRTHVLARRAGGVIELLQNEAGLLVDPDGIEPLAAGMLSGLTLAPDEREAMVNRAYASVETSFTIQQQAQYLRSEYEEILEKVGQR